MTNSKYSYVCRNLLVSPTCLWLHRFRRPVELYDTVVVGCRVLDVDQPRGEFKQEYAVWSEKQSTVAAVGGCTIVVCDFDKKGGPRTPIPEEWLPKLMALH